jgi:hypothetical protein
MRAAVVRELGAVAEARTLPRGEPTPLNLPTLRGLLTTPAIAPNATPTRTAVETKAMKVSAIIAFEIVAGVDFG